jgi:hypothetical protein
MSSNQPQASYAVDIVFCVDCTGSMGPYLDAVKATAKGFHGMLAARMGVKNKAIRQLRTALVAYRDLIHDGPDAIKATRFFLLPDESAAFDQAVSGLRAEGGGDDPESGLEALAVAIASNWDRSPNLKRRHVIVLCTDAPAHPLGRAPMAPIAGRPAPRSLEELQARWGDAADDGDMDFNAKRLLVFAPDADPWAEVHERFENCIWVPSQAGEGMRETDMDYVVEQVVSSI